MAISSRSAGLALLVLGELKRSFFMLLTGSAILAGLVILAASAGANFCANVAA